MRHTTSSKLRYVIPAIVYLLLWEALALYLDSRVLLVSPVEVATRLIELSGTAEFWLSVLFSIERIFLGLIIAIAVSFISGVLSARFTFFRDMIEPVVMTMKATPVASIVILVLIWVSSRNLSVVISFMMVFPVMHTSFYEGIANVDISYLEMAKVYGVRPWKRIRYLYLPGLAQSFESGITISLGLCFKSGIAAEVIGLPDGSIGERVYEAKIYLSMPDLFASTVTVIILAFVFERVFLYLSRIILRRISR